MLFEIVGVCAVIVAVVEAHVNTTTISNDIQSKKHKTGTWIDHHTHQLSSKPLSRKRRALIFPSGSKLDLSPEIEIPVDVLTSDMMHCVIVDGGFLDFARLDIQFNMKFPLPEPSVYYFSRNNHIEEDKSSLYQKTETFLSKFGLDGKACLLRAICEINESPLEHNGLLGEVLNMLLAASYGVSTTNRLTEYIKAEVYGRQHGNCWAAYPSCPLSFFHVFDVFDG